MHRHTGRATDIKTQTHARTHTPTQMFFILCPYMYVTHLKRASQHGPESCSSMVTQDSTNVAVKSAGPQQEAKQSTCTC